MGKLNKFIEKLKWPLLITFLSWVVVMLAEMGHWFSENSPGCLIGLITLVFAVVSTIVSIIYVIYQLIR